MASSKSKSSGGDNWGSGKAGGPGIVRPNKYHLTVYFSGFTTIDDGLEIGSAPGYKCADAKFSGHPHSPLL
jgi:hypothetical protein